MGQKRIIILGAGLAGLSAAWHLQKQGIECQLFEREEDPGGLCRSKKIKGFTFDYSGHLLHFRNNYARRLVKGFLGSNLLRHKRSAWVYSYGAYKRYPFQTNLYGLPPAVVKECVLGFISASKNKHPSDKKSPDFLSWIFQSFGPGIARHFMVPYNTKFWTVPLQQLTCQWLDGFIPVPSLGELIEGALKNSRRQVGYNSSFYYPARGGIAELPNAIAAEVKNIHLKCEVIGLELGKREIKLAGGGREKFDYLISTLPLPQMARLIRDIPSAIAASFKKLRWNSILNLNLGISRRDNHRRHWAYFPQEDLSFFRVGFFHNFSPHMAPEGKEALYVEISYSKDRPLNKAAIALRAADDLKKVGLLKDGDTICLQDSVDIQYGYPLYDAKYSRSRIEILEYLRARNVLPRGRYGSWRYMSMEDAVLDGKMAAELFKDV